jgi:MarR family transcriptional regulator for hemolysin
LPASQPSTRELFGIAIGDCARIWRNKINERLKPLGLSLATWQALLNLSWFPDGLGQRELAERLGIEGPTLVRLIDRLEQEGLVARRALAADRRCKRVVLTERAWPTVDQVKRIVAELRTEIMSDIPDAQLEAGLELLAGLRQRLTAA